MANVNLTTADNNIRLATMEDISNMSVGTGAAPLGGKLVCTAAMDLGTKTTITLSNAADYLVIRVIQNKCITSNITTPDYYGSSNSYYSSICAASTIQNIHADDVIVSKGGSAYILASSVGIAENWIRMYARLSSSYDEFYEDNFNRDASYRVPTSLTFNSDGLTISTSANPGVYITIEAYSYT